TLVDLYALTGQQRYLDTSRRFYHRAILDPLAVEKDELTGKHANTQIPKVIGEARTFEVTGDANGRKIAEFFWNTVVHQRSWVNGGNSDGEHFFPVGNAHEHLGPATAETCNTYNMLKLTEHLFEWQPTVELADYFERGLYNHILASQEPIQGMFTYFVSLKPGHFKTYSTPENSFWCCVGTGMENHTKYGEAIYFHSADNLFINLFIPSELTWKERGLVLEQRTNYPNEDFTELTVQTASATPLKLLVRCPVWTAGPAAFALNGEPLAVKGQAGKYTEILRTWKKGDRLRVTIPMAVRIEKLEGDANKIAFLYGPLLLAGDLGAAPETGSFPYAKDQGDNFRAPTAEVPVLVRDASKANDADLADAVVRLSGKELAFSTKGLGQPHDVTLRPFNGLFYQRYNVYWDVFSNEDWKNRQAQLQIEKEQRQREEARIVDELNLGEQQSEVDHRLKADHSRTGDFRERKWRDATDGGYFEFQMKVLRSVPQVLRCTYWGDEVGAREFEILINGQVPAIQKLDRNKPGKFFDVEYPIAAAAASESGVITIRFQPRPGGNTAGGVFHCATLKAAP
ncbi:MAG: uncharacterized protein QOD99_2234, partial [Chthoniobacter sp.]|nr:uncharacterized protein [Chthoniobacter sp.]